MGVRDVDLNSEEWRDLVFEDRNKEYGAYYLRKTSTRRHLFALSAIMVVTGVLVLFIKIIDFDRTQLIRDNGYEVKPIELSNLIWLEESLDNNNQVKTMEEKSPLEEIVKFTPPVITKDESIVQDPEELKETDFTPDSTDTSSAFEENSFVSHREATQLNQEEEHDTTVINEKNKDAEFQDEKITLLRYIYQNIQYPSAALKQRIHGRVICSFIVNEDGSISDVTLVQGVYIFLDEEVLRVIHSMPLWKPAMKSGKPIKVKYITPVVFKLK